MVDPPSPDTGEDTPVEPDPGSTPGTPRWVKVFGIIALVVVVLLVVLLVLGRGHGPGRHAGGGGTPPSGVTHGEQRR